MSRGRKGLPIELKGPAMLPAEVIKDICDNRFVVDAQNVLAVKHNISSARVRKVWGAYFGGTKIADAKGGLKKPLPTAPVAQKDISVRQLKTERATYTAKEPKTLKAAQKADQNTRAQPARKIAVSPRRNLGDTDLEIDPEGIANMTDEQAQILAGEVEAGNNSDLVREAINALVLTNKNLTSITKRHLRAAYNKGAKNSGRGGYRDESTDESETDGESNSCDVGASTDAEECSDLSYESDGRDNVAEDDYGVYPEAGSVGQGWAEGPQYIRPGIVHRPLPHGRSERPSGYNQGVGIRRPTTHTERAQPVYINGGPTGGTAGPLQADNIQASRYEQALPTAQHYQGQECLQSNNARYDSQFSPQAYQGNGAYSAGGTRPGQAVAGISWLRPRKA